MKLTSRNSSVQ